MAGRPFGSKTKPQIRQFILEDDIREIMAMAIKKAKEGDTFMAKFLLEEYFGKAPQPVVGEDGDILQILVKRYGDTDKGDTTSQVSG